MIWTEEQDTTLRTMRDDGASYDEIGSVLGVTRNAVSGRVNRLKLVPRPQDYAGKAAKRWQVTNRPAKAKPLHLKPMNWRKGKPTPPMFFAVHEAPKAVPVPLIDRTGCCYPVTEHGPHLFCNEATDGSYCKFHRSVMYKEFAA